MHKTSTLIAVITLTCACSPLRKTQTVEHLQTETTDTTLTSLIRREIEHSFGSLRQTVVEFYPMDMPDPQDDNLPDTLKAILPPQKIPARRPVKRITYTEVSVHTDRSSATDSISRSRINTAARSDTQVVTEEKPSSAAAWLRWVTALATILLLILLLIKLR